MGYTNPTIGMMFVPKEGETIIRLKIGQKIFTHKESEVINPDDIRKVLRRFAQAASHPWYIMPVSEVKYA